LDSADHSPFIIALYFHTHFVLITAYIHTFKQYSIFVLHRHYLTTASARNSDLSISCFIRFLHRRCFNRSGGYC